MRRTESFTPLAPDLRSHLQRELLRRCRANPRYSMRAFARTLRMESSYLSKVLAGKRPVREWLIERVAPALGLTQDEIARYRAVARGGKRGEFAPSAITRDTFSTMADWWHYAIMELTQLDRFRPDPAWIARELELPVPIVTDAIARLLRLGLLKQRSDGNLVPSASHYTILGDGVTEASLRRLQRGVLEKALQALEEVPVEERDQASMTMAIPRALLPEARRRLQRFRRQLCAFLQSSDLPKDSVYHLSLSLYPVTRPGMEGRFD